VHGQSTLTPFLVDGKVTFGAGHVMLAKAVDTQLLQR
jgi:hypothetical protein